MRYYLFLLWAALLGRRHGHHLIPAGGDPAAFVQMVQAVWQGAAHRAAMQFVGEETRLKARWDLARLAADLAWQRAEEARERECALLRRCDALADRAEQLRSRHDAAAGGGLPPWGYVLLVTGLCALELPLVYLSFTTFGLPPLYTLLLAALCSALTGLLGHSVGSLGRHLRISAAVQLGAAVLCAVGFALALAYLRESAMAALKSDTAVLDPQKAAVALFAISAATLVVAALLAWHQPVSPLAREMAAAARAWRHARRLTAGAQRQATGASRVEMRLHRRLEALRAMARYRVLRLQMDATAIMQTYVNANVESREMGDLPEGLRPGHLPQVSMPAELEQRSESDELANPGVERPA